MDRSSRFLRLAGLPGISGMSGAARHYSAANPYPVPTETRWYPLPATAADDDSRGEQVTVPEVMKVCKPEVMEVMKVRKVSEAALWKVHGMTKRMYARSAGHAKVVHAAHTVHAAQTAHRVGGQCRWHGKHRYDYSASNRDFAEHDNPPGCHHRAIVRAKYKIFK